MRRGHSKTPARSPAVVVPLVLCLAGCVSVVAAPLDAATLGDVLQNPRPVSVPYAAAEGTELLALSAEERTSVERWLRRGGRLTILGEAAAPALELMARDGSPAGARSAYTGLGRVGIGVDGTAQEGTRPIDGLRVPAADLARAGLPSAAAARRSSCPRQC